MNILDLEKLNLIIKLEDKKYQCNLCEKIFSKIGIGTHYFYQHSHPEAKERLRKISTEQNNKPEMIEKISKGTKKAYEREEVRINQLNAVRSKEYRDNRSRQDKEQWTDPILRAKRIKSIKASRTPEFNKRNGKLVSITLNKPESKTKTKENSENCRNNALKSWNNPEERKIRCESAKRAWENPDRRKNASLRMTEIWKDPKYIEIILAGKIRALKNQNKTLGKCGLTKSGTYYESTFERDVYSFLEENSILFEPHKTIPNSSKICDLVINNVWVELDGLGRARFDFDSEFSWKNKLVHYENLKETGIIKDFKIFLNVEDFINWSKEQTINVKTI
jgi:hypothetical protein